jgi:hypothetical protein
MTFEQKSKEYLLSLKNDGVFVDADIHGINEEMHTANCVGRFHTDDNTIEEKSFYVYLDGETMKWRYFKKIDAQDSE